MRTMSVTAGVIDAVIAVGDKLRGKIGQTKVKRYWPGKAPAWADDLDEVEDTRASKLAALEMDDRRMRRLAELRAENKAAARNDHKRKRQAEIISTIEEENDRQERAETEEEDEDAIAEKRLRVREKLLQREQEEAALLPIEEEESEYDTESESEQQLGIAMAMPVFLPKPQRDTIAEREIIEEEERRLEESAKKRSEEIKGETKQIVAEEIRKDEEIQKDLGAEASIADIDTDDDMDEAEEYEAWKTREIAVIKRQREEREARLKEKEEIEKVSDMAEEERKNQKKKWRFMQKYHHKGAFFQSDPDDIAATEAGTDDIFQRDFSAPTGEDKMNKSILPKIMQVKQFGRSGRTKWTHLVNEDTTDWNAL